MASDGILKRFSTIRGKVIKIFNRFLISAIAESSEVKLMGILNGPGSDYNNDGLFKESGLPVLLKSKDYAQFHNIPLFIDGITERSFAQGSHSPIIDVLSSYADLVNITFRRSMGPGWTSLELNTLQISINIIKNSTADVLQKYSFPGHRTKNFPMLSHLVFELNRLSDVPYMMEDSYKSSHNEYKED